MASAATAPSSPTDDGARLRDVQEALERERSIRVRLSAEVDVYQHALERSENSERALRGPASEDGETEAPHPDEARVVGMVRALAEVREACELESRSLRAELDREAAGGPPVRVRCRISKPLHSLARPGTPRNLTQPN